MSSIDSTEFQKTKRYHILLIGIAAAAIVATGFICFCVWFLSGSGSTYYYGQIDNSKLEQTGSKGGVINFSGDGNMDYSYTLFC